MMQCKITMDPIIERTSIFVTNCAKGRTEIVKQTLKDNKVDPSWNDNIALNTAIIRNKPEIVKLLLNDERVDPSYSNNRGILIAVHNNYYEIINLLLEDVRVNPADNNSITNISALGHAIMNFKNDILEQLLKSSKFDSINDYNYFLKLACAWNNNSIDILLNDKRFLKHSFYLEEHCFNYLILHLTEKLKLSKVNVLKIYKLM